MVYSSRGTFPTLLSISQNKPWEHELRKNGHEKFQTNTQKRLFCVMAESEVQITGIGADRRWRTRRSRDRGGHELYVGSACARMSPRSRTDLGVNRRGRVGAVEMSHWVSASVNTRCQGSSSVTSSVNGVIGDDINNGLLLRAMCLCSLGGSHACPR